MAESRTVIRNWRDVDSYVSHESAVIWAILSQQKDENSDPFTCMQTMSGFARHFLQGHKNSDHHWHNGAEQFYYILSGGGEVLIGDERFAVGEGSVTYFPPEVPHQFFAENEEDGVEHLIITRLVEREGSKQRVTNWRDATPTAGEHGGAVTWSLLEPIDADEPTTDQPCLLGFQSVLRQALVRGKASDIDKHDKEQVYYVLEGEGLIISDGDVRRIGEGDTIYQPPGVTHQIVNDTYDGWLSYLVVS
jgi:mannose-6-phosphate isomerase-like protein (cupin superfamily)